MEHTRRSPRYPMKGAIALAGDDRQSQGNLINLSTGGCAVESETLMQRGDYLVLRVYLSNHDLPVEVDLAAVRWSRGREYGLEFIRIRNEVQQQLRQILATGASALQLGL